MSEAIRLLDVSRRRGHSTESVKKILNNMAGAKNSGKVFNTLEFSDYEKVKDITLETFKELTYQEQKEFLNALISMKTHFSSPKQIIEQLPDAAIFQEIKDIVPKNIPKFQYGLPNAQYREQAETVYNKIILSLLEQLHKEGQTALPHSKMQLRPGRFLDIKPPLVDSICDVETKMALINGYDIKTGNLPPDKRLMVHNLDEESFTRLEALLLTDENAVLCAGRTGGRGYLKGSGRPGVIISPKSPEDCLIQAKEDVSSGYGAVKNFYNIQSAFLTKENEANTYVPDLIRKRLNLTQEEYNKRIGALCNTQYIKDIKNVDEELYNTVCDILDNEQMFEAIVRSPEIEAICLPEGYKISETIARFCKNIRYSGSFFIKKFNYAARMQALMLKYPG